MLTWKSYNVFFLVGAVVDERNDSFSHLPVASLNASLISFELTHLPPSAAYMHRLIIVSGNGLSPVRCQAITRINDDLLSIGHLETNFSEIVFEIITSSIKELRLNMSSGKWQPFCLGLNVLKALTYIALRALTSLRHHTRHKLPNLSPLFHILARRLFGTIGTWGIKQWNLN